MNDDTIFTCAHILMSARPGWAFEHALAEVIDHADQFERLSVKGEKSGRVMRGRTGQVPSALVNA